MKQACGTGALPAGINLSPSRREWRLTGRPWVRLVLLLLPPYPALTFIRGPLRRRRHRLRGLCLACGYDLTGNISGRCPECGGLADAQ